MHFIAVFIATLAAVASASHSAAYAKDSASSASDSTSEKRSCVANYSVSCQSGGDPCCDGWQCVGATEWNDGVCIPNY
ncbi:hypothetical protein N7520_007786 [Penicillium odoratum]|uniref:uncharacterized protein n=1 Tax=Penicillium odoratum TaxID=1167516 RepID=UPI002547BEEE|nr:uncharacterized protein N7520_007786 [Penicillium odoratum]KAJ5760630.1 hypothetical protein N7520_007786 [Penicillium odoratum]